MLDFNPVRNEEITYLEFVAGMSEDNLRTLTNDMIDTQLALILECSDENVVFKPQDPRANDPFAQDISEADMPWTLGHLIVHITASSEEAAFLAAELARGVPYEARRSRYEIYWTTIQTIGQCRQRLDESRRMRLASLDVWPNSPHIDNTFESEFTGQTHNAITRFIFGLKHDDDHLAQIADVIQQAEQHKNFRKKGEANQIVVR
jgi:hypothetical protein